MLHDNYSKKSLISILVPSTRVSTFSSFQTWISWSSLRFLPFCPHTDAHQVLSILPFHFWLFFSRSLLIAFRCSSNNLLHKLSKLISMILQQANKSTPASGMFWLGAGWLGGMGGFFFLQRRTFSGDVWPETWMMRRDQLFEELGDKCSRERGKQEKGLQWGASSVCLRRRLARRTWGIRESGGREARPHRATKECAEKSLRGF